MIDYDNSEITENTEIISILKELKKRLTQQQGSEDEIVRSAEMLVEIRAMTHRSNITTGREPEQNSADVNQV